MDRGSGGKRDWPGRWGDRDELRREQHQRATRTHVHDQAGNDMLGEVVRRLCFTHHIAKSSPMVGQDSLLGRPCPAKHLAKP